MNRLINVDHYCNIIAALWSQKRPQPFQMQVARLHRRRSRRGKKHFDDDDEIEEIEEIE